MYGLFSAAWALTASRILFAYSLPKEVPPYDGIVHRNTVRISYSDLGRINSSEFLRIAFRRSRSRI
jgi:hypothetical protein